MLRFLRVLLVVFGLSVLTWSQTEGATLSGRITDQTGSVIVGAQGTATDADTNVASSTKTNDNGIFIFPSLEPGNINSPLRPRDSASWSRMVSCCTSRIALHRTLRYRWARLISGLP